MKTKYPQLDHEGEVTCSSCPLESGYSLCRSWWTLKGDGVSKPCPTLETYQEACELAEKEAQR